ncbi:hypothetical protein TruAng_002247 [Truncatella angustata]|nr:hypothetical protein TruAng_002247 [Truncatella angustata]
MSGALPDSTSPGSVLHSVPHDPSQTGQRNALSLWDVQPLQRIRRMRREPRYSAKTYRSSGQPTPSPSSATQRIPGQTASSSRSNNDWAPADRSSLRLALQDVWYTNRHLRDARITDGHEAALTIFEASVTLVSISQKPGWSDEARAWLDRQRSGLGWRTGNRLVRANSTVLDIPETGYID